MRTTRYAVAALVGVIALMTVACVAPDGGTPATTTSTTSTTIPPDDPNGVYVAVTGEDTGDCKASATPCLTITYAVSQAVPNNTVYVAAGTYAEVVPVNQNLNFEGANVGIAGTATRGAESIVKGFRNPGNPGTTAIDVSIDGFRIDPQGDAALISASASPLVWLRGGTSVVVQNNVLSGGAFVPNCSYTCTTMTDYAFTVQSGTASFNDNLVENFRRPVNINQPVGAPATTATVADNTFTGITSRAISLAGSTGVQMGGQVVTGNDIDATGITSPSSPAGITVSNQANTISNNTFTAFSSGVYIDICKKFNTDNNSITGNTFTGNGGGVNINVNSDGGQCISSATEGAGGWVVGGGQLNGLAITGNDFLGNTSYAVRDRRLQLGLLEPDRPGDHARPDRCQLQLLGIAGRTDGHQHQLRHRVGGARRPAGHQRHAVSARSDLEHLAHHRWRRLRRGLITERGTVPRCLRAPGPGRRTSSRGVAASAAAPRDDPRPWPTESMTDPAHD